MCGEGTIKSKGYESVCEEDQDEVHKACGAAAGSFIRLESNLRHDNIKGSEYFLEPLRQIMSQ